MNKWMVLVDDQKIHKHLFDDYYSNVLNIFEPKREFEKRKKNNESSKLPFLNNQNHFDEYRSY